MAVSDNLAVLLHQRIQTHPDGSKERWRDVPHCVGYWRVSDRGRVKALTRKVFCDRRSSRPFFRTVFGGIRRPDIAHNGYEVIHVRGANGYSKLRKVHILVLEAFVGFCPPGLECRHLDGNPVNNFLTNLCWGTHAENMADRDRHGTTPRGELNGNTKLTDAQAAEVHALFSAGNYRYIDLARRFGVERHVIAGILTGKTFTHLGIEPPVQIGGGKGVSQFNRGQTHNMAKLTEDDVRMIRREFTGKRGDIARLARKVGISADVVRTVVRGKSWTHVV
jgi:hypothetical protein